MYHGQLPLFVFLGVVALPPLPLAFAICMLGFFILCPALLTNDIPYDAVRVWLREPRSIRREEPAVRAISASRTRARQSEADRLVERHMHV